MRNLSLSLAPAMISDLQRPEHTMQCDFHVCPFLSLARDASSGEVPASDLAVCKSPLSAMLHGLVDQCMSL